MICAYVQVVEILNLFMGCDSKNEMKMLLTIFHKVIPKMFCL